MKNKVITGFFGLLCFFATIKLFIDGEIGPGAMALLFAIVLFLFTFKRKNKKPVSKPKPNKKADKKTAFSPNPDKKRGILSSRDISESKDEFDKVLVKVAGVTFKNGRRSRQTILREIYWKDFNYSGTVTVTVKKTEYEGSPAFEVWANEEQVGFVPKEQVEFFVANWDRFLGCGTLNISGGGNTPSGEKINYGASFIARFAK